MHILDAQSNLWTIICFFSHFHLNGIQHVHVGDSTQIKSGIDKKKKKTVFLYIAVWYGRGGGVFSQYTLKWWNCNVFQVDHVKSVHIIGAFFAFIVGGMYFYIQAYISWSARDIPGSSKIVRVAQLIICVLYAVFAIIGTIS